MSTYTQEKYSDTEPTTDDTTPCEPTSSSDGEKEPDATESSATMAGAEVDDDDGSNGSVAKPQPKPPTG